MQNRQLTFFLCVSFCCLCTILSGGEKTAPESVRKTDSAEPETKKDKEVIPLKELREKAAAGDAKAQFELGNVYFYGDNSVKSEPALAVYWYRKAAEQDLTEAQFNCGLCYEQGFGVKRNAAEAVRFYQLASDKGYPPAMLNLSMIQLYGVTSVFRDTHKYAEVLEEEIEKNKSLIQPEKGIVLLEKTAALPNQAMARIELASWIFKNMSRDEKEAAADGNRIFQLLKEAENMPNGKIPRLYRMLADCEFGGMGTSRNDHQQTLYLQKAVDGGDAEAMVKLAYFLEHGIDSVPDSKAAFELYKRSSNAGFPYAQYKYAEYIACGYEPGKGFSDALKLYQSAANFRCPEALHRMGIFLDEGIGVERNPEKSAECFSRAAKLNYAPSQLRLGMIYCRGISPMDKDESAAFYWFERAAKTGSEEGLRLVALCYNRGIGCSMNEETAYQFMKRQADSGDIQAIKLCSLPPITWPSPADCKLIN